MYLKKPLREFLEDAASKTPTPGGGSVAALAGSLGAALLCMVGNFTLGKEKYRLVEKEVGKIFKEAEKLKGELSSLIQGDIKAYEEFSRALRMPKGSSEMRQKRAQALEKALKQATQVPLETARSSFRIIELAKELLPRGNPNLISDIGVAVLLAEAALQSAALNVEINLGLIKDEEFREEKRAALSSILSRARQIKNEVLKEVREKLA